jgi:hypothetical protein
VRDRVFELGECELNLRNIGFRGMFPEIIADGLDDLAAPALDRRAQRTEFFDARFAARIWIAPTRILLQREESFRLGDGAIAVM